MKKLFIATQNKGKLNEIQRLLMGLPVEVLVPESEIEVKETGKTFEENAKLKSQFFFNLYPEHFVLADDSGLVVDALNGRPGVFSKRYGESDSERNKKLLGELRGVVESARTARFVAAMSLRGPGTDVVFEGVVDGKIAQHISGSNGFGYDPVFIPDGYDQTFAELGVEVKNTMSHRARALIEVKKYLVTHLA